MFIVYKFEERGESIHAELNAILPVSHCFSLFLTVSHCFSPFLTMSLFVVGPVGLVGFVGCRLIKVQLEGVRHAKVFLV